MLLSMNTEQKRKEGTVQGLPSWGGLSLTLATPPPPASLLIGLPEAVQSSLLTSLGGPALPYCSTGPHSTQSTRVPGAKHPCHYPLSKR